MKSKLLKFVLLASLVLNISVLAAAGYVYYRHSFGYWVTPFGTAVKKGHFLFEELFLGPEQEAVLKERVAAFREEIDVRRGEILEKRKELFALLREKTPDAAGIEAAISSISRMQEEMQRRVASHILGTKAFMDKSQQRRFMDLIEGSINKGSHTRCVQAVQD